MTKHDKIQAAIWTPTMVTVAVTAMYWCGTDAPSWGGLILCAAVAGVCGAVDFIYERRRQHEKVQQGESRAGERKIDRPDNSERHTVEARRHSV